MVKQTIVIVGSGLAGVTAADTLRRESFDGRILLFGDEAELPYNRPPLSKDVLRGETAVGASTFHDAKWYEERDIELCLGVRVTSIDPRCRAAVLENGAQIPFDRALIAVGGRPRNLPVPGAELDGILPLRTQADAVAIRERLARGTRVVVVGGGFIGTEVAASARLVGCDVTLIEMAAAPMSRVVGPDVGDLFATLHRERGADLRLATGVARFEGDGQVRRVVAPDGSIFEADLVVLGVGITCATDILAGVSAPDGIVVDEYCETCVPGVFAAGDIARHPNPIAGLIRVEQWQNAQHQGAAAARNMLGQHKPFVEVPWFWSDQYDVNFQMAGIPSADCVAVFRGEVRVDDFSVFYLRDGAVKAIAAANRVKDVRIGRRLIERGAMVLPEKLADPDADLAKLLGPGY